MSSASAAALGGIINECSDISFNHPALLDAVQYRGRCERAREREKKKEVVTDNEKHNASAYGGLCKEWHK